MIESWSHRVTAQGVQTQVVHLGVERPEELHFVGVDFEQDVDWVELLLS